MVSKGFSIIELMVAMVIVAILSSFAVPGYKAYIYRSKTLELLQANTAAQMAVTDYVASTMALDCSAMPQPFNYPTSDVIQSVAIDFDGVGGHGPCLITVTSNDTEFDNLGNNPVIYSVATVLAPGNISWTLYSNGSPYLPNNISQLP